MAAADARRDETPLGRLLTARADYHRAATDRQRIEDQVAEIRAHEQQGMIDAEVRATRRILLDAVRRRAGAEALMLIDRDFLAVADRPTIVAAMLDVARTVGRADFCDLQIYDPTTAALRMEAHRGFSDEFLEYFATVGEGQPTACAVAVRTRQTVVVDDVTRNPIFAGQPTLAPICAAGSRAIRSYPLLTPDGRIHGVLSLHYRRPAPAAGAADLVAASAAHALTASRR
ncbi:GAF domain-containing protein [Dactylosporangium sp. CS-033363]|uniref:GAF domain-containing protein n=1 Tax=Dactylosporangium sp. CS-033363 TaxID=3239935 RepID=UPI003D8AF7A8